MKRVKPYHIAEYFRNPEIRRQLAYALLIGGAGAFFCLLFLPVLAVPVLLMWGSMEVFHLLTSYARYRRIAEISSGIDRVLHTDEITLISRMQEGELSILEDEINKMLARLREQNLELRREKTYLADSLTDLSHQLKTPLTSMNLIFSMMDAEELTEEKQTEYVGRLKELSGKVRWLIDVLLKISRLDADAVVFEKEPCDLGGLARGAARALEIPMELKELTFRLQAREAVFFSGDRKWTAEAVENILKNCMEHTPRGGTLAVSCEKTALYSQIVIEDDGEGIAREDLPHLFERFYKGRNSGADSAGIGLALASMIVAKQGGVLRAENREAGGARFTMRFYHERAQ